VSASREHIAVYALLHEVAGSARLVGEEADSQHLPQVEQEARHFRQIHGRVQIDYLVLEDSVDVEQQEKQNAARAVRGASDLLPDLLCLWQQKRAVEVLSDARDRLFQEREQLRLVAGVAQTHDHVVYFALRLRFLGWYKTTVTDTLSRTGARHRCAQRLQGTHQIACIFLRESARERLLCLFILLHSVWSFRRGAKQKTRAKGFFPHKGRHRSQPRIARRCMIGNRSQALLPAQA